MKKLRKIKAITNEIWKYFSEWIRRKDADSNGMVRCYTCGKVIHWKEANASHYLHNKLDFEPANVKPCCVGCNKFKHGNLGAFAERLIFEYGADVVQDLRRRSNEIWKPSREELAELLEHWKQEVGKLK